MRHVEIIPAANGAWLYTVCFNGRIVLVGLCTTRERAEAQARMA